MDPKEQTSEILNKILTFSSKKMQILLCCLQMAAILPRPQCVKHSIFKTELGPWSVAT